MKSEAEMLKYRNFGKKSLNEIKDKLSALGLQLGMKIDSTVMESPADAATAALLEAPVAALPTEE
jgi:DNA-directed RNA polymerase subunit alpha